MGDYGSNLLFKEIFQETSTGDFGIQIQDGPLFRCHTQILQTTPGIIGKVREFGVEQVRTVDRWAVPTAKDYFTRMCPDLIEDTVFEQFTLPPEASRRTMIDRLKMRKDPTAPSYTTSTVLSGQISALKRRDPYFLAERYLVDGDCERLVEILRYCYQSHTKYFDIDPTTERERSSYVHKMLKLCYDAEKFSVDDLYEKLLSWFGQECFFICGEKCFADAFYHLQHFELRCTEEHSRQALFNAVSGDMLASREQFRTVTRDPRWSSLPIEFVEGTLKYDDLPIGSESEILNLIERWNAYADKDKADVIRLLCCFRASEETKVFLQSWLTSMGWIQSGAAADGMPDATKAPIFLKYEGKISRGGDLLTETMTVAQAKETATSLPDCKGFFVQGDGKSKGPVQVVFKCKFVNEPPSAAQKKAKDTWSSFRLFRIKELLDGTSSRGKAPRRNLRGKDLEKVQQELEAERAKQAAEESQNAKSFIKGEPKPEPMEQPAEAAFVQYHGARCIERGFSFKLGAGQKLVQAQAIRSAGLQRLRVTLSNPSKLLWDPEHEVFVGMDFGEGKYFGYLCSATAFSGIFCVRALASAAPAPSPPVHLTGSGNKVEFDAALEVQLMRINFVVQCKLSIIFKNETIAEDVFQVSGETLKMGPGLRYQLVATGLLDEDASASVGRRVSEEIDVQLGWVSGGDGDPDPE